MKVQVAIDILENELIQRYPGVLDILLCDHATKRNIFWATDNYQHLGEPYQYGTQILPESITGINGNVIMPRIHKNRTLQLARSKEMAEVFTPSWVCNAQNNLIDSSWFGRDNVFNVEIQPRNGNTFWQSSKEKITFPKNKTWRDYVSDTRLEIACGEAPYLASRYDTTTGEYIPLNNRIGLLDRKLRVINENVDEENEWLAASQIAFQNIYAYEWQGDSLLLAREALLITFIENYTDKFGRTPLLESILNIAHIISWNIWQMDGLKGVVPNSCFDVLTEKTNLFGPSTNSVNKCKGCESQNNLMHNGIYCIIMNWENQENLSGIRSTATRFIDLLKN